MKVIKSKRNKNTMSLEIEASVATIEEALTKTFKSMVKHAKVPGFRPGKVPRDVFEQNYGKEILLKDGISEAVNMAYMKAIKELDLKIVDYPQNVDIAEYKENEPLTFTCEVDVEPEVKVDKYKGLKVEKESSKIDEALVEQQLNQIRESGADYKLSEEAAVKEDLLKINVKAAIDGEPYSRWTKNNMGVCISTSIMTPAFDEHLIGKKAKEQTSFDVTYADDFHIKEAAGKKVDFEVEIVEVKKKELPELDDALAEKMSQFKTVAELKANIEETLTKQREKEVTDKLKEAILEALIEKNPFDIPQGMINNEVQRDKQYFQQTLQQSKMDLTSYLAMVKQTDEEFTKQLEGTATKRLQSQLLLEALMKQEKIEATDEDITAEIKKMKPECDTPEKVEAELKKLNRDGFKVMIKQNKVFDLLTKQAKISEKKAEKVK